MSVHVPNAQTLDLNFEYVRDAPEKQLQDVTDLDSKYYQVFAGASVIIGAAALVNPSRGGPWVTGLAAVALAAYLVLAVISFVYLRTVKLHGSRYGGTPWDDFKSDTPRDVKLGIVLKIQDDYAFNRTVI